jgi:hypothetical protein
MSNLVSCGNPVATPWWIDDVQLITGCGRPNTLIVGPRASTETVLEAVRPQLVGPVWVWECAQPFSVGPAVRTVVARNLHALTGDGQHGLLHWMDRSTHVQFVTLCRNPPYELVGRGLLVERLYYRLNVLSIFLPDGHERR